MAKSWPWIVLPVAALIAVLAYLLTAKPLDKLTENAPPVEQLSVETVRLTPGLISLTVRADGSQPLAIAQIQVDGAYRNFTAEPAATLGRLASARIDVPFPWVPGETHHITFVTSTGVTFSHTIDVAVATPERGGDTLARLALIGILLGVVPIAIGLLAYPALRAAGPDTIRFMLALTVGLLLFLFVDTLSEGLEKGGEALERLHGQIVVWVAMGLTTLVLLAIGRSGGKPPEGVRLAFFIALGIGLHNLGEGLAVGAAIATGAAALATFLVIGFVVHNVTEGIGIAAPLIASPARSNPPPADANTAASPASAKPVDSRETMGAGGVSTMPPSARTTTPGASLSTSGAKRMTRAPGAPSLATFVGLACLAGLPAVAGVVLGTSAVSPYWTAVSFGVGAGAILQVVIEVAALIMRKGGAQALAAPASASGIVTGLVVMYATALFV